MEHLQRLVTKHWSRAGTVRLFGLGTLLFGLGPAVAPGWFGRLFDLPVTPDQRLLVMVRSVGVRDASIGLGLMLTAARPAALRPWLVARIVADAGDSLAVAIAVARGARQPRFVALGVVALMATLTGLVVEWLPPTLRGAHGAAQSDSNAGERDQGAGSPEQ